LVWDPDANARSTTRSIAAASAGDSGRISMTAD
jgi:hypothetical protein